MWAQVFDYAIAKELRTAANPARWKGLQQHLSPQRASSAPNHFAALPYPDLPAFMARLRAQQVRSTAATALEFAILTCVRSGEAVGARWEEFDLKERVWTIPAKRMKAGREHRVPLSDRAMTLLERRREFHHGEYVFTGYSSEPLANKAMAWMVKRLNPKITVHGFRSTFRDWAGDVMDFASEVIELCLAHRPATKVEKAYRRGDALEKRRTIMQAWATYCGVVS